MLRRGDARHVWRRVVDRVLGHAGPTLEHVEAQHVFEFVAGQELRDVLVELGGRAVFEGIFDASRGEVRRARLGRGLGGLESVVLTAGVCCCGKDP